MTASYSIVANLAILLMASPLDTDLIAFCVDYLRSIGSRNPDRKGLKAVADELGIDLLTPISDAPFTTLH